MYCMYVCTARMYCTCMYVCMYICTVCMYVYVRMYCMYLRMYFCAIEPYLISEVAECPVGSD